MAKKKKAFFEDEETETTAKLLEEMNSQSSEPRTMRLVIEKEENEPQQFRIVQQEVQEPEPVTRKLVIEGEEATTQEPEAPDSPQKAEPYRYRVPADQIRNASINVLLRPSLLTELRLAATAENLSKNEYLNRVITDILEKRPAFTQSGMAQVPAEAKSKRFLLKTTQGNAQALKELARDNQMSVNDLLNQALAQAVKKKNKKAKR